MRMSLPLATPGTAKEKSKSWHDAFKRRFPTPYKVLRRDKKNVLEVIWIAASIITGVILHSKVHRPQAANSPFANSLAIRSRSPSNSLGDPNTNVTWQTSFFALVSLGLNNLSQPSGRICGINSQYRTYMRVSPVINGIDGAFTVAQMLYYCWKGDTLTKACTRIIGYRNSDEENADENDFSKLEKLPVIRMLLFLFGAVFQVVKLGGMSNIPGTQLWGAMYFFGLLVIQLVIWRGQSNAEVLPLNSSARASSRPALVKLDNDPFENILDSGRLAGFCVRVQLAILICCYLMANLSIFRRIELATVASAEIILVSWVAFMYFLGVPKTRRFLDGSLYVALMISFSLLAVLGVSIKSQNSFLDWLNNHAWLGVFIYLCIAWVNVGCLVHFVRAYWTEHATLYELHKYFLFCAATISVSTLFYCFAYDAISTSKAWWTNYVFG